MNNYQKGNSPSTGLCKAFRINEKNLFSLGQEPPDDHVENLAFGVVQTTSSGLSVFGLCSRTTKNKTPVCILLLAMGTPLFQLRNHLNSGTCLCTDNYNYQ